MRHFRHAAPLLVLSLFTGCTSSEPETLDPGEPAFAMRHKDQKPILPSTPEEVALWLTTQAQDDTGFSVLNIGVNNRLVAVDARCTSKPYLDEKRRLVVDAEITEASIRRYGYLLGHTNSISGYGKRNVRVVIHK